MRRHKAALVAGIAVSALVLTACASDREPTPPATGDDTSESEETTDAGDADEPSGDDIFIFGAAGKPKHFDPFYASDGETFRATRQIYEQLLDFEPGTAQVGPGLSESWESSEDGLTWDFTIRDDVKFHDGTDLDAAAICYNFDRWYNQPEAAQNGAVAYYWINNFGGFADTGDDSLFESCTATDDMTAQIKITRFTSKFPAILAHGAYAIGSPAAMDEFDANGVEVKGEGFTYPAYALEHPTGTGAFSFGGYDDATGTVTLDRFNDYWGDKAGVSQMVIRTIPDETTRRQELEAGTIHGYDLPNPVDWAALEDAGNEVLVRPAFNILYVGLNATNNPALKDLKVRQALSHAINRQQLVDTQLPDGATAASQFFPDTLTGYNSDLSPDSYDPDLAKELLAEAGQSDLEIEFWQPTEVTRPYMPDPANIYDAIRTDWEAIGVTINPVAKPWAGGYLDGTEQHKAHAFLLGWTGDYDSADNFIGTFFAEQDNAFSTTNYPWADDLTNALVAADSNPEEAERVAAWQEINAKIAKEYVPGLPISHSPPAIVVNSEVKGLIVSPLAAEDFASVSLG